jgi:hypothetical protein
MCTDGSTATYVAVQRTQKIKKRHNQFETKAILLKSEEEIENEREKWEGIVRHRILGGGQ